MSKILDDDYGKIIQIHKNHVRLQGYLNSTMYDFICIDGSKAEWLCLQYQDRQVPKNLGLALTALTINAKTYLADELKVD